MLKLKVKLGGETKLINPSSPTKQEPSPIPTAIPPVTVNIPEKRPRPPIEYEIEDKIVKRPRKKNNDYFESEGSEEEKEILEDRSEEASSSDQEDAEDDDLDIDPEEDDNLPDAVEAESNEFSDSEGEESLKPSAMTKRQKALQNRTDNPEKSKEELLALPLEPASNRKKKKSEEIDSTVKKTKYNDKRQRKEELQRKAVLDKLLNRQAPSKNKTQLDSEGKAINPLSLLRKGPFVKYTSNAKGKFVSFPVERVDIVNTLRLTPVPYPPPKVVCGICKAKPSVYKSSKTNIPLCSLSCYQRITTVK